MAEVHARGFIDKKSVMHQSTRLPGGPAYFLIENAMMCTEPINHNKV